MLELPVLVDLGCGFGTYTFLLGWAGMRGSSRWPRRSSCPRTPRTVTCPPGDVHSHCRNPVPPGALPALAGSASEGALVRPRCRRALAGDLFHQASQAGLAELEELEEQGPHAVGETIRDRVRRRDFAPWERPGADADETPSETYGRWRKLMIDVERRRVLEIRSTGTVPPRWSTRC